MRHKNTLLGVVSLGVLLTTVLSFPSKRYPPAPTQDRTTTVAHHVARSPCHAADYEQFHSPTPFP